MCQKHFVYVRSHSLSSAHDSRWTCAVVYPLNRPLAVLLFSRLSVHVIVWQIHTPVHGVRVRSVSSCWIYKWVMQYALVARSHIALPPRLCWCVMCIYAWARTSAYVHVSFHCVNVCIHAGMCEYDIQIRYTTTTHTETARTEWIFFHLFSHYSHTHNEQIAWFRYVV